MPTSYSESISPVIKAVEELSPQSILDVGCGFGHYGVLFREYLDICKHRYFKKNWQTRLDAVEIFERYLTPVHAYIYDNVYIGDIRKLIFRSYDLIFMGDIIEHFKKEEIVKIIESLSAKWLLITTPLPAATFKGHILNRLNHCLSKPYNPYEKHIHLWEEEDFKFMNWQIENYQSSNLSQIILLKNTRQESLECLIK